MDMDCLVQRNKAIFAIRLAEKASFYITGRQSEYSKRGSITLLGVDRNRDRFG